MNNINKVYQLWVKNHFISPTETNSMESIATDFAMFYSKMKEDRTLKFGAGTTLISSGAFHPANLNYKIHFEDREKASEFQIKAMIDPVFSYTFGGERFEIKVDPIPESSSVHVDFNDDFTVENILVTHKLEPTGLGVEAILELSKNHKKTQKLIYKHGALINELLNKFIK